MCLSLAGQQQMDLPYNVFPFAAVIPKQGNGRNVCLNCDTIQGLLAPFGNNCGSLGLVMGPTFAD